MSSIQLKSFHSCSSGFTQWKSTHPTTLKTLRVACLILAAASALFTCAVAISAVTITLVCPSAIISIAMLILFKNLYPIKKKSTIKTTELTPPQCTVLTIPELKTLTAIQEPIKPPKYPAVRKSLEQMGCLDEELYSLLEGFFQHATEYSLTKPGRSDWASEKLQMVRTQKCIEFEKALDEVTFHPDLKRHINCFMNHMDCDLKDSIAEEVAEALFFKPEPQLQNSNFFIPNIICRHSTKPSLPRLLLALFTRDYEMLKQCLADQSIDLTIQRGCRNFRLLYYAIHFVGDIKIIGRLVSEMLRRGLKIIDGQTWKDPYGDTWRNCSILLWSKNLAVFKYLTERPKIKFNFKAGILHQCLHQALADRKSLKGLLQEREKALQHLFQFCPEAFTFHNCDGIPYIDALFFQGDHASYEQFREHHGITPGVRKYIERQVLHFENHTHIAWLPETQQKILIEKTAPRPIFQLEKECELLTTQLHQQLLRWNLAPEWISLALAYKAYCLKREIKFHLKEFAAHQKFQKFFDLYHKVIAKHPMLHLFHQELGNDQLRTVRMLGLLGQEHQRHFETYEQLWKCHEREMHFNLAYGQASILRVPFEKRRLAWIHGTKSHTLLCMLQTDKTLHAAGKLLKMQIAPLAGVINGQTIDGFNVTGISGFQPNERWEEPINSRHESPTRVLTAMRYATRRSMMLLSGEERLLETSLKGVSAKLAQLIDLIASGENLNEMQWHDLKIAVLRLQQLDKDFISHFEPFYHTLNQAANQNREKPEFQELLQLWKKPQGKILIQDHAPYPMMFGKAHLELVGAFKTNEEEVVINHSMQLGQHLQLIAVPEQDIKRTQELLNKYKVRNVSVINLEGVKYLELRKMALNERRYELSEADQLHLERFLKTTAHQTEEFRQLKQTARNFHRDVLPYYASPYSPDPHYLTEEGVEKPIPRAPSYGAIYKQSYASYARALESDINILPRMTYGAMYSARVTLCALMLTNLHRSFGRDVTGTYGIAIAAAFHGAGRRDEGEDHWQFQSAVLLKEYLTGISTKELDLLYQAINYRGGKFSSLEQEIVHDAISLGMGKIEKRMLAICERVKDIDKLLDECRRFVVLSDTPALKTHFEHYSEDYLRDLGSLMLSKKNLFPIMVHYLEAPLIAFGSSKSS